MGRLFAVTIVALLAAGCATPGRPHALELNRRIASRSWDAAVALIDEAKDREYGPRNAVLYWLDRGAVLHHAGRYRESDAALDLAEQRMEELYTRSVSKAAASFLVNEATEDYAGQVHERTLLHVMRALNYAYLRDVDEAAVEARKVTAFLTELNDRLGDERLAYRDDAFAQYLSALLFQDQGRADDARISFEASRAAYGWYATAFGVEPPPLPFGSDGGASGRAPAFARTPAAADAGPAGPGTPAAGGVVRFAADAAAPVAGAPGDLGELVLLHYNGPGPRRETATLQLAWGEAMVFFQQSREAEENTQAKNALIAGIAGNAVTIAYPVFVQDPFAIQEAELEIGEARARTVLVEDVSAIARSTLAAALPALHARAAVRAVVKYLLARLAEQEAKKRLGEGLGMLAGIATRAAAAATEVADTRGWIAVPAQFRMARVPLRPGRHTVKIRYLDAGGGLRADEVLEGVEILPGRRTYVHVRTAT